MSVEGSSSSGTSFERSGERAERDGDEVVLTGAGYPGRESVEVDGVVDDFDSLWVEES